MTHGTRRSTAVKDAARRFAVPAVAGILDRRVAPGGGLRWPNAVLFRSIADISPEPFATVRTCKTRVEPSARLDRHAVAVDGR
jgi:hypothetical protein